MPEWLYELVFGRMITNLEIPALPPRSIVLSPPLTDEEFEHMCEQTKLGSLERSKEGTILSLIHI